MSDRRNNTRENGNRQAIDILYPGSDEAAVEIDIIAVHGLGSNVDWSWTWKDKSNPDFTVHWLKDPHMLPAIIPNARILAYNYDSQWHIDAPKTRLQICGEELIRSVNNIRDSTNNRPLIFIGHSLGGLVIQHGLLFANTPRYNALLKQTIGFVALGVPFRGSEMQTHASYAASFLSPFGSDTGIIQSLSYDNPYLRDKLQELCQLRETLPLSISCFYELYGTNYGARFGVPWPVSRLLNKTVVPEESACIAGCTRIALQTDHLAMNKYSHPGDRSFNDVAKEVIRIYSDWRSMQTQDEVGTEITHMIVPFGQNESFVGRGCFIEKLRRRLPPRAYENTCQRTAIMGPSGLGKTQIAIEAVYRIRRDHPLCSIFWVPAMNIASFENAYREIGQALNVAGIADVKANIKAIVKTALSHKSAGEWLLILDSMNDMEVAKEIYEYLPFSLKGSILFTTQSNSIVAGMDLPKDGIQIISSLERSESIQLLKCRLDDKQVTDSKSLNMLADFLGDIPLAIRQAASYIFETQITTANYLERCQSNRDGMTEFTTKGFDDEAHNGILRGPIAKTCKLSVDRLRSHFPLAAGYLRFVCFLADNQIPISLLSAASDDDQRSEAISALQAYSLVDRQEDSQSVHIHPLVSQFMRELMQVENTWTEESASVIKKLADFAPEPTEENRDLWMAYLPHLLGALEPRHGALDEQDVVLRHKIRNSYIVTGKDKEAKEIFQDVVRAAGEGLFNTTNADKRLDAVINDVLGILHKQGRHEEAGSVSREIMRFQRRVANVRHLDTALAIFAEVIKERRS